MYTLCFTLYYCIMYSVYSVPGFVIFAILTFPEHFVIMSLVLIRLLFYWNILVDQLTWYSLLYTFFCVCCDIHTPFDYEVIKQYHNYITMYSFLVDTSYL